MQHSQTIRLKVACWFVHAVLVISNWYYQFNMTSRRMYAFHRTVLVLKNMMEQSNSTNKTTCYTLESIQQVSCSSPRNISVEFNIRGTPDDFIIYC